MWGWAVMARRDVVEVGGYPFAWKMPTTSEDGKSPVETEVMLGYLVST